MVDSVLLTNDAVQRPTRLMGAPIALTVGRMAR